MDKEKLSDERDTSPPSYPNLFVDRNHADEAERAKKNENFAGDMKVGPDGRQMSRQDVYQYEDVFGDEQTGDVQYRSMSWLQCALILICETVSLGVLSLPSVLASIGIVPGLILIVGLGLMATYTGYVIGQFKVKYPYVHNMADAGEVLLSGFGPAGRIIGYWFFLFAQTVFLIFSMASHVLTFTIALHVISDTTLCRIVWGVIGIVVMWICDIPRTFKKVSWLSLASFTSIVAAVVLTMIAIGIDPRGLGDAATHSTSFFLGFNSVTSIIFAYAGHVAFFSIISELREPREFPKSLFLLQSVDIIIYVVAAIVIYYYAGDSVKSPALGSTSKVVSRVAYGVALPTIIIAGVIYGHVATKTLFVRVFRGTKYLHSRGVVATSVWLGLTAFFWVIAFVIAMSIPVFGDLLSFIAALFASWFTYGLSGIFWLYINKGQWTRNWKKMCLTAVNWVMVALGLAICGIGLYASGKAIHDDTAAGEGGSWTCDY